MFLFRFACFGILDGTLLISVTTTFVSFFHFEPLACVFNDVWVSDLAMRSFQTPTLGVELSFLGKEWTTTTGEFQNYHPMWIKRVSPGGHVEHVDWTRVYIDVRAAAGITYPGRPVVTS